MLLAQGTADKAVGGGTDQYTFRFVVNGTPVPNITSTINIDGNDQETWVMTANVTLGINATTTVQVTGNGTNDDIIIPDMQFQVQGVAS